ncbi:MAG TPA: GGDEF domain-containing protein [Xanthomonadaceae bacterium]|nr:GGDEF domain-containing protein [Xanthomonadaceae bacterium]
MGEHELMRDRFQETTPGGQQSTERSTVVSVPEAATPGGLALLVFEDDCLIDALALGTGEITVGRSPQCRVRLQGSEVSRRHCSIRLQGEVAIVRDVHSANGTFVNGRRIRHSVVTEGMLITLGNALLKLVRLGSVEWRTHSVLLRQVHSDDLSGLLNRRGFRLRSEALLGVLVPGTPIGLMVMDIDHFKQVNGRYGHIAGDAVIRAVGARIRESLDAGAVAARLGGEEFGVLLGGDSADALRDQLERLRVAVQQERVECDGESIQVTMSIGAALEQAPLRSLHAMFIAADRALFEAKAAGRNRWVMRCGRS